MTETHGSRVSDRYLFECIEQVAAAVCSRPSPEDVLAAVVDQAKGIARTDKAALCLVDGRRGRRQLDERGIVVRGSRSEYPESWWLAQVRASAPDVFDSGRPQQRFDRTEGAWLLCVPVKAKDKPVGVLVAINPAGRRFAKEEVASLTVVSAFASVVVENARLAAAEQHNVLAEERKRIAKEMHDGLAQRLFTAALGLEFCRKRLADDPEGVAARLNELQVTVQEGLGELRQYIFDLRPPALDRLGLAGAIRHHMEELLGPEGIRQELRVEGSARVLSPTAETCVYRVAQELVANAARHSGAPAVRVVLRVDGDHVALEVRDRGAGFDVEAVLDNAEDQGSLGLKGIAERVEAVGGTLDVSSVVGRGTTVRVVVPA